MTDDLLTRLRQWAEKPNEGDPIIDAMAADLAEAAERIAELEAGEDLEIGEDLGRAAVDHLRFAYPDALAAVPKNAATSLRNFINIRVRALMEAKGDQ